MDNMLVTARAKDCKKKLEILNEIIKKQPNKSFEASTHNILGRFKVWGNGLGAFANATSKSSIDYRLRKAPKMTGLIHGSLMRLYEATEHACSLCGQVDDGSRWEDLQNMMDELDANNAEDTELLEFLTPKNIGTDELLKTLESQVDRLYRIAELIRRDSLSRSRQRLSEAITLADDDTSLEIHMRHLKDKHPKLVQQTWLRERLGRGFSIRRSSILALQRKKENPHMADSSQPALDAESSVAATTYDEQSSQAVPHPDDLGRSTTSQATSFANSVYEGSDGELVFPDLTRLEYRGVSLSYNDEIECPFCRRPQFFISKQEWRTHVFRDLMPYVCTFNDCTNDLFRTRHEWFRHELELHRRQWICHLCKSNFTRPSLIESHFREAHPGRIADHRVQAAVSRASRPLDDLSSSSCAFCDDWKMPPGMTDETMELCRHVGRHQEYLALDAIPRHLDDLVIIEEDQGSETHDLQSDGLSTPKENMETGSPARSLESELAPQDQRYPISIQADQSFSQKVWVRQEDGQSKIMVALHKAALPFNIITTKSVKKFNLGPPKDAHVVRHANLTSFGDVTFRRLVTAPISTSDNGSLEREPIRVDFHLLPNEIEQLSHQRTKPLAEAVLGHQFASIMTKDEDGPQAEDPAPAPWITTTYPSYRLRKDDLMQYLASLFGERNYTIDSQDGDYLLVLPRDFTQAERDFIHEQLMW